MSRITAPVGEVTTPTTRGRNGTLRLRARVEQALLGELPAPRLEQRHQRADARGLDRLDDDLVGRLAGKGRESAGRDDFEPLLRLDPHALERAAPDDGVEPRVGVLEGEIRVARGMRSAIAGDLAAHPDVAEAVFERALERVRKFADGDFGRVGRARVRLGHRPTMPDAPCEAMRAGRYGAPRAKRRMKRARRCL